MNVPEHNLKAWNRQVALRNPWTLPVTPEVIAAARRGDWSVGLTTKKAVPRNWFGRVEGAKILCLASGGGQQGPVLAAAGADITVFDLSPAQLAQDRLVAERDGLRLDLQLGEMTDLSRFPAGTFDMVFHPVANTYIPELTPLWREAYRVLRPRGRLLAGFTNPLIYLFNQDDASSGKWTVGNRLPYSDVASLPPEALKRLVDSGETLQFSHTLTDQIGGQLDAGFSLSGFYEDDGDDGLERYTPSYCATLALKS